MSGGDSLFATTHWSRVLDAAGADSPRAEAALAALCESYWLPLYAYVRRRGYPPPDAQDLTQGFFARLLRLGSLGSVCPERGKFRAFLLAALKHYLADCHDHATAQKRDARRTLPLDAEARYHAIADERATPERLFERQWALALLEATLARLRGEAEATGRGAWFEALCPALTGDAGPHAELAARLGTTPEAVRVAIHRLRQRYRSLLREEILRTVGSQAEVEEELRALRRVLSS